MNQKKQLKCYIWAGIIFVLITGTLSHFLYEWTNKNVIAGLFTPVNESIWEHMKLVFFPMLIYSSLLISKLKNTYPCIISALCFGILAGTVCIPAFFYSYTFITGKSILCATSYNRSRNISFQYHNRFFSFASIDPFL